MHMWDIKLKLTDTVNGVEVTRGKGLEGAVKGVTYMLTEEDLTLGGGHTMQYRHYVSQQKCILETYIILLTNVAPINLINPLIIFFKF